MSWALAQKVHAPDMTVGTDRIVPIWFVGYATWVHSPEPPWRSIRR